MQWYTIQTAHVCKKMEAMKIDYVANGCEYFIAENIQDIRGWDILWKEPFKKDVKRLHCKRMYNAECEFKVIYCSDEILKDL